MKRSDAPSLAFRLSGGDVDSDVNPDDDDFDDEDLDDDEADVEESDVDESDTMRSSQPDR